MGATVAAPFDPAVQIAEASELPYSHPAYSAPLQTPPRMSFASLADFADLSIQQLKAVLGSIFADGTLQPVIDALAAQPGLSVSEALRMHPDAASRVGNNSVALLLLSNARVRE